MIAEVLGEVGWNTYMTGKWHLTAEDEMNLAFRKSRWPVGRGFERFYGFLGAETNQWYPDLVCDNHPVDLPRAPSRTEGVGGQVQRQVRHGLREVPGARVRASSSSRTTARRVRAARTGR
jgi:arylsulfatase A-like enzyme